MNLVILSAMGVASVVFATSALLVSLRSILKNKDRVAAALSSEIAAMKELEAARATQIEALDGLVAALQERIVLLEDLAELRAA